MSGTENLQMREVVNTCIMLKYNMHFINPIPNKPHFCLRLDCFHITKNGRRLNHCSQFEKCCGLGKNNKNKVNFTND